MHCIRIFWVVVVYLYVNFLRHKVRDDDLGGDVLDVGLVGLSRDRKGSRKDNGVVLNEAETQWLVGVIPDRMGGSFRPAPEIGAVLVFVVRREVE